MTRLVAVTGATGFVGSHLIHHLGHDGWAIRILARRMPIAALTPDAALDVVLGDLDDPVSLRRLVTGADVVIHVAGIVKAHRPEDFVAANVEGTRHLVAALRETGGSARLILVSSLAAREPQLSPYAASKRAAEDIAAAMCDHRPVTIVRPSAVYGPGDREILPVFQAAARGICPHPAVPAARVSLIHVKDLAHAIGAAAKAEHLPELRYEVDDGHADGYSWAEIAYALGIALQRSVRPVAVPRSLLSVAALLEQTRQRMSGELRALSLAKVPELFHPDWAAEGPSLSATLGLSPGLNLTEGFTDTVNWYRKEGLLQPGR